MDVLNSGAGASLPRQAVILAGGRAQRLGALARETPKPLLSVGGRPFVEYLLDTLAHCGFSDILLACGRLGEQIIERYHGRDWQGARITCQREAREGGTAGALWLLREHLQETFALLNGDTFFDLDWLRLAGALQAKDAGVVALKRIPATQANRYGTVQIDPQNNLITGFAERPTTPPTGEPLINGGAYILRRRLLSGDRELPCSLERDILPQLAHEHALRAVVFSGTFIDIGVPQDYRRAQTLLGK